MGNYDMVKNAAFNVSTFGIKQKELLSSLRKQARCIGKSDTEI